MEGEEGEEHTIANDLVVTKYNMAAEIAQNVLKEILQKMIKEGTFLDEICDFGDRLLEEKTAKVVLFCRTCRPVLSYLSSSES